MTDKPALVDEPIDTTIPAFLRRLPDNTLPADEPKTDADELAGMLE